MAVNAFPCNFFSALLTSIPSPFSPGRGSQRADVRADSDAHADSGGQAADAAAAIRCGEGGRAAGRRPGRCGAQYTAAAGTAASQCAPSATLTPTQPGVELDVVAQNLRCSCEIC